MKRNWGLIHWYQQRNIYWKDLLTSSQALRSIGCFLGLANSGRQINSSCGQRFKYPNLPEKFQLRTKGQNVLNQQRPGLGSTKWLLFYELQITNILFLKVHWLKSNICGIISGEEESRNSHCHYIILNSFYCRNKEISPFDQNKNNF